MKTTKYNFTEIWGAEQFMYTYITTDGVTHYYRTFLNPEGIWDEEGRVDYRVYTEELPLEDWNHEKHTGEIVYDAQFEKAMKECGVM